MGERTMQQIGLDRGEFSYKQIMQAQGMANKIIEIYTPLPTRPCPYRRPYESSCPAYEKPEQF